MSIDNLGSSEPPVLLLDVSNLSYRNYFARKLSPSFYNPTIYGMFSDIVTLVNRFSTTRLVFCFDGFDPLRSKYYPRYKMRQHSEDRSYVKRSLLELLDIFKQLEFSNIVNLPTYEADDLIGCYCQHRTEGDPSYVMVSTDKDLYQLLSFDQVVLYDPIQKMTKSEHWLERVHHMTPGEYLKTRALIGDPTDNIAGIKTIGPQTALRYVRGLSIKDKRYRTIREGIKTFNLNLLLMELPYKNLKILGKKDLPTQQQIVSRSRWDEMCYKYKIEALAERFPF
jgi:DNA polymerase I